MIRLNSLQVLRYVAAALVFLYHGSKHSPGPFLNGMFDLGYSGVDVFFVLSGFVIALSQSTNSQFRLSKFYLNRFYRIFPSYWMFLFVPLCLLAFWRPELSPSPGAFGKPEILLTFFLIFGHPVVSQVTWTLSYELFFYLIYGLVVKFSKGVFLLYYGVVIFFATFLINVYKISVIKYILNPIILEFLMGVLAFKIFSTFKFKERYATLLLVAGLSGFLFSMSGIGVEGNFARTYRFIYFGIPAFTIVLSLALLERDGVIVVSQGVWSKMGDASYVLYLIHSPLVSFASIYLPGSYYGLGMIGLLLVASGFSIALFSMIDKPVYKFLRSLR